MKKIVKKKKITSGNRIKNLSKKINILNQTLILYDLFEIFKTIFNFSLIFFRGNK